MAHGQSAARLAVFLRTRSGMDVKAPMEALTATVHDTNPELPVFDVGTTAAPMSASMAGRYFILFLMSVFAVSALLLAALGIYGVIAFLVDQRAQDLGIRTAVGARPRNILALALRLGLTLTATGTIVGLAASIAVTWLMSSLLFGVSTHDSATFAAMPVVLGVVTLAACFLPRGARREPLRWRRSSRQRRMILSKDLHNCRPLSPTTRTICRSSPSRPTV
jgi:predicted lysophospholipase L1 biosynthesis ABC-type transport system permease subunit